jgi:hypothetical protein
MAATAAFATMTTAAGLAGQGLKAVQAVHGLKASRQLAEVHENLLAATSELDEQKVYLEPHIVEQHLDEAERSVLTV